MDEYLDLIKIYYNEKLLLSTKDKDKKCNECQHDIQFKEIYGELILNCGDKSGSKLTKAKALGITILTEPEFGQLFSKDK